MPKVENPIVIYLSLLVLTGGALTAFGSITGTYNKAHTNEQELANSHPVSAAQMSDLAIKLIETDLMSRCRWLQSEIRALEDSIYVRRRDQADPDFIHKLEQDLNKLKKQSSDLGCGRRLA